VQPDDLLRYLAYEVGFVVGPGWLFLRAIAPGVRSRPWQLALGWPLGLTLEILAFSVTAALGVRDLFVVYPLVVAIPAALVIGRRARPGAASKVLSPLFTARSRWAVAGLCLLAFAYIGGAFFTITPLPGSAQGVLYPGDQNFQLSIAASALHHWPPTYPAVSGLPFHYHYFVFLHMAAISQVTGLHLPLVDFRLYLIPLTGLLLLQLALAGRLIGGGPWTGVLTVALFLLVREIDLSISDVWPFAGIGAIHLWSSASQLLGMTLFVSILVTLALLLDPALAARAGPHLSARREELWVILTLLLVGAGGAKAVILPLLGGGLVIYLAWARIWRARWDAPAIRALGLVAVLFAAFYLLMYAGTSQGLRIHPPATIRQMPPLVRLHDLWPAGVFADGAFWIVAVTIGTLMYFGPPLLGLAMWLRQRPIRSLEPSAALAVSLLLAGAVAFFFLYDEYIEQTYLTLFGLIAVLPFSAAGLAEFVEERRQARGLNPLAIALFAVVWVSALWYLAVHADHLIGSRHPSRADLLAYGPALLGIALLAAAALLFQSRLREAAASLATLAILLTAALDIPLDTVPWPIRYIEAGEPIYPTSPAGLRPGTLAGMEWVRDHVPEDGVLAVSNERTRRTRYLGSNDGVYPALTEHRTFREAWSYTARANELGQVEVGLGHIDPFPERTALEQAVFARADPESLRTMVDRYGVTDIVVSTKDGAVNRRLYRLGRLVYSNGAVDVIDVTGPIPN
jgi:hypothetical protein